MWGKYKISLFVLVIPGRMLLKYKKNTQQIQTFKTMRCNSISRYLGVLCVFLYGSGSSV